MRIRIALVLVPALLAGIACLNRAEPFGDPPQFDSFLLVDTGYTGTDSLWGIGEYSAFRLHWNPSDEAEYYVIKYYPVPVTLDNWDEILVADTVDASMDSADVTVQPGVFGNVCISCGLCVDACPREAITLQADGRAVIDLDLCTSCGECVRICPVNAIENSTFGQPYYFGVRAYGPGGMPSNTLAATTGSYKIIYYNDPIWCGKCRGDLPYGGDWSGCYIINTFAESGAPTGPGCPVDAIWQDVDNDYMVYIDYEKCIHCGICFIECWNYGGQVDPGFGYMGLRSVRRRVVPGWYVPDYPEPPAR